MEKIADFHNDFLTARPFVPAGGIAARTDCAVCALYYGGRPFARLQALAENFAAARPQNLFLGLEDVGYLAAEPVSAVLAWKPVYASLTWNGDNALAGGCYGCGRLTARGEAVVRALAAGGVAVDCAHLGPASFCDVLDCGVSVVDSHTCLSAVHPHPRNLADWQAGEIVARGGLIGIAFVGDFLCAGNAAAADVFRHLDHGVQKFGPRHFCIGSDFYGTQDVPAGLRGYGDLSALRACMERAGYPPESIAAILHGNLRRFLFEREKKVP